MVEKIKIEIFGSGCKKCQQLHANTLRAVKELGIDAEVIKMQNVEEFADRGVMITPALAINGEIKSAGKVINPEEIKKLLSK